MRITSKYGDPYYSDIQEWLQEIQRENLVDDRVPEQRLTREFFSWTVFRAYEKCGFGKTQCFFHFPKDRNCEICQRTNITRATVQKNHWQSRTSCRKFWWFDYSRSQSSQWRLWISKQSSICSRGARLGHPMDPVVSVQDKNFSGNTKELAKFLGAK